MSLIMVDRTTDRLVREIATLTGETLTVAIRKAVAERLEREKIRRGEFTDLSDAFREIGEHCAALPDRDTRTPDEIVGYDENGMW